MELTFLHFVVLYSLVVFFRTHLAPVTEPGYSCTVWIQSRFFYSISHSRTMSVDVGQVGFPTHTVRILLMARCTRYHIM